MIYDKSQRFTVGYVCTHMHTDCWQRKPADRPTFLEVLDILKEAKKDSFFCSTSYAELCSFQEAWKQEIQVKLLDMDEVSQGGTLLMLVHVHRSILIGWAVTRVQESHKAGRRST